MNCFLFYFIIVLIALLLLLLLFVGYHYVKNLVFFKACTSQARLDGKTVIITGATAGIGKEAARDFARRGARVILACRNLKKGRDVADNFKETTGNDKILVKHLDTSLLSSVRDFAKDILQNESRIDILALNAGTAGQKDKLLTKDGLEDTMATNHFGHFLLVNLLLGLLESSAPCRVVVTASQAHYYAMHFDPQDLNFEKKSYTALLAYAQSKVCNILMTKYLAAYFRTKEVTVNCFCPGLVKTEIFNKTKAPFFSHFSAFMAIFTGRTCEQGAQTLIHLAVSEEVQHVSGEFFVDCKIRKPSSLATDVGMIKKIWEQSEDAVKLTPQEKATSSRKS